MNEANLLDAYLRLGKDAALKHLERPFVYHIKRDELYEIDEKAEEFLLRCNGMSRRSELTDDAAFVEYCIEEELLEALPHPAPVEVSIARSPVPSLRYLELQLTHRCNFKCRHCYLGPPRNEELSLEDALGISREFSSIGGLRLMISGGEPMLWSDLRGFLEGSSGLKLRRVLMSNGSLITSENAGWLNVEEVQFSLDGWRRGHEMLRGKGAFDLTMRGIAAAKEAGIPISIATMIHRGNVGEFERMSKFIEKTGAVEWGVDVLCVAGTLVEHRDLMVPGDEAAPLLQYAFGGGYHGSSDGYACGRHLMTVLPSGICVKCGFYEDDPLGNASEGLLSCWRNLEHIRLDELECRDCPVISECAGGCRFRAPGPLAPDPLMCAAYGINHVLKRSR